MKEIYVPPHLHIYMCNLDIYICEGAKEGEREKLSIYFTPPPRSLYLFRMKRKRE
jgi:hypothetical protein